MAQPPSNHPHDRHVPLDAPAAAAGAGSFKQPLPIGTEPRHGGPVREAPRGRHGEPRASSGPDSSISVEKEAILGQLATLYIGGDGKKGFEGFKDFLYADSEGHVTVGVGHLVARKTASEIDVRKELARIPLRHTDVALKGCSGPIHEDHKFKAYQEVRERYEGKFKQVTNQGIAEALQGSNFDPFTADSPGTAKAILGMSGNDPTSNKNKLSADAYAKDTLKDLPTAPTNADLRLSPDDIRALLERDLGLKYDEAFRSFPGLDTLPTRVQLVVVDVLFNGKGVGGKGGWTHFKRAINERRWDLASRFCGAGIDADRDRWRRKQLDDEALLQKLQERLDLHDSLYIA